MHPVLLKFGPITLYTYGLFVALGFVSALFCADRLGKRSGIDREIISNLFFVIFIFAILGARLLYVLLNFSHYVQDPLDAFKIWNGGLVFFGGFIAALAAAIIYVRLKGIKVWETADVIAPALALGHAVGRIGCFFAGCCHGKVCDLPWAIRFEDPNSLAPLHIPLHPTQLYSVFSNLSIFLFLLWLSGKKSFPGKIFWVYIFLYGILRSFIEIFRGDDRGDFFIDFLSVSQGIGLTMAMISIVMLIWLSRRKNCAGNSSQGS